MYLILISFVLFFVMIILFTVNKRLSKTAVKDVYVSLIGENDYTSKMLKKEGVKGGAVGSTIYLRLITKYAFKVIRDRKKKGLQLELIEKMYFEAYKLFENQNVKNTTIYDRLIYIDGYCRVMLIAKAILRKENYKLDYKSVDKFFNEFDIETPLTYDEINSLKDALIYQIYVELKEIAKYVLHVVRMKRIASKKQLNPKYLSSLVYCYFRGQNEDDFAKFEETIKSRYYDYYEAASLFHNLNSYKTARLYNCVYAVKFLNTNYFNPLNYYGVYDILQNDFAFKLYPVDTKRFIMEKLALTAGAVGENEGLIAEYLLAYASENETDLNSVIEAEYSDFLKLCKVKAKEERNKKKLKI